MKKNVNTTFPAWDCVRLLDNFGASWQIQDLIAQHGFKPPPIKTINGWRQRNSIPVRWALFLVNFALKNDLIANIDALARRTPRQKLAERRPANPKPEWADL